MKIDTNAQPLKIRKPGAQAASDKGVPAPQAEEAQAASGGDKVNISQRSRLIAKARELVSLTPDIRAEKVADLTARIAAGTYKVDSETVANSIIRKNVNALF